MATRKSGSDAPKPHPLLEKLSRSNAGQPIFLVGFIGPAPAGSIRIHPRMDARTYYEVATSDVLHHEPVPGAGGERVRVAVKEDAQILDHRYYSAAELITVNPEISGYWDSPVSGSVNPATKWWTLMELLECDQKASEEVIKCRTQCLSNPWHDMTLGPVELSMSTGHVTRCAGRRPDRLSPRARRESGWPTGPRGAARPRPPTAPPDRRPRRQPGGWP